MANLKISELPAAATLTGAETLPVVQGGVTSRRTVDQMIADRSLVKSVTNPDGSVSFDGISHIAGVTLGEIALYAADEYSAGEPVGSGQTIESSTLTGSSNGEALQWSAVLFDTTIGGAWDQANPTRLVVPAGATKMMISASVNFLPSATGSRWVRLTTGSVPTHTSNILLPVAHATIAQPVAINTGWIDVVAGAYFELRALQDSGSSMTLAMGNASNKGASTFLRAAFK